MVSRYNLYITLFFFTASAVAQIHELKTVAQYDEKFMSDKPMITIYSGTNCGPCKTTKPHFVTLSAKYPDIHFCIVDADNDLFTDIMDKWNIRGIPHIIYSYEGKKLLESVGGLDAAQLEKYINDFQAKVKKQQPAEKSSGKQSKKKDTNKKSRSKKK